MASPAMGDRPSVPGYRALTEWLWIALGIFSLQTAPAFAKSLPVGSSRRWPATAATATPAMGGRPSMPGYTPLPAWLWIGPGMFSLQTGTTTRSEERRVGKEGRLRWAP